MMHGNFIADCGLNEELKQCGPICSCAELLKTNGCAEICGNNRCFCIPEHVWDTNTSNVCIPIDVCYANAETFTGSVRSPGPPAIDAGIPAAPAVVPRDLALSKSSIEVDLVTWGVCKFLRIGQSALAIPKQS